MGPTGKGRTRLSRSPGLGPGIYSKLSGGRRSHVATSWTTRVMAELLWYLWARQVGVGRVSNGRLSRAGSRILIGRSRSVRRRSSVGADGVEARSP